MGVEMGFEGGKKRCCGRVRLSREWFVGIAGWPGCFMREVAANCLDFWARLLGSRRVGLRNARRARKEPY